VLEEKKNSSKNNRKNQQKSSFLFLQYKMFLIRCSLACRGVKLMQIRSYAPFRLKQTQVRPLPIQVGDPQVASSAYNHQYLCFNYQVQQSLQQPMTISKIFPAIILAEIQERTRKKNKKLPTRRARQSLATWFLKSYQHAGFISAIRKGNAPNSKK
jgi:hypothetical protein